MDIPEYDWLISGVEKCKEWKIEMDTGRLSTTSKRCDLHTHVHYTSIYPSHTNLCHSIKLENLIYTQHNSWCKN